MKIVLFDLETLPNLKEVMKIYCGIGAYPGLTLKATITSIICFGYKIHGRKHAKVISTWDFPKRWKKDVNDDYDVCKAAYDILHDADVVVGHHINGFDWKHLQTRLMVNGLPTLPTSIIKIDTKQISSKNLFAFNNRLGTLGEAFVKDKKLENNGWITWVGVSERKEKDQKLMARYCKQDVNLLEKLFIKFRPLIKTLPNPNLDKKGSNLHCPNCSSQMMTKQGIRIAKTAKFQQYQCQDCGSWAREKVPAEKTTLKSA